MTALHLCGFILTLKNSGCDIHNRSYFRTPKPGLKADTVTGVFPKELSPDDESSMKTRREFAKQIRNRKENVTTEPL